MALTDYKVLLHSTYGCRGLPLLIYGTSGFPYETTNADRQLLVILTMLARVSTHLWRTQIAVRAIFWLASISNDALT